jgi:hypothetical protein
LQTQNSLNALKIETKRVSAQDSRNSLQIDSVKKTPEETGSRMANRFGKAVFASRDLGNLHNRRLSLSPKKESASISSID